MSAAPISGKRPSKGKAPPVSSADDEATGILAGVGTLWDKIKSVKEILGALSAIVIFLVGAIAWTVAHFATQQELNQLECTTELKLTTKSSPLYVAVLNLQINSKIAELAAARVRGGSDTEATVQRLQNDLADLRDELKSANLKYREAVEVAPVKCSVKK